MRKDAARRGVPAPDERTVKEYRLNRGVEVPNMAVLKDFFRLQTYAMRGKIEAKPIDESLISFVEWFFGGFTRDTETAISKTERSEMYVQRELAINLKKTARLTLHSWREGRSRPKASSSILISQRIILLSTT